METGAAEDVVAQLHRWNLPASVVPRGGGRAAVRVRLPLQREAVWDSDSADGLRAQVLRDGILVGYVPELPGTRGLGPAGAAWIIATAEYDDAPSLPDSADVLRASG